MIPLATRWSSSVIHALGRAIRDSINLCPPSPAVATETIHRKAATDNSRLQIHRVDVTERQDQPVAGTEYYWLRYPHPFLQGNTLIYYTFGSSRTLPLREGVLLRKL